MPLNYEFKARCKNLFELVKIIQSKNCIYLGEDDQIDTYFFVTHGRLKLREGKIENALIYYQRMDITEAKFSEVLLYQHQPDPSLKKILTAVLGVKVIIEKCRQIYFIGNVKFHFDNVKGLGTFIEVEAIDNEGNIPKEKLQEQCLHYMKLFNITSEQLVAESYSDLLTNCNV